jgi:hypothetical protein
MLADRRQDQGQDAVSPSESGEGPDASNAVDVSLPSDRTNDRHDWFMDLLTEWWRAYCVFVSL